jgi:hypothetical protein
MGMSAGLMWPELLIGEEEEDVAPPEFNSADDWAQWLLSLPGDADLDLEDVGCGALSAYASGSDPDEVSWVSPAEILAAADRLADLVRAGGPDAVGLLASYVDYGETGTPVGQLVLGELEQVRSMARWAQERAKTRLAFEIG